VVSGSRVSALPPCVRRRGERERRDTRIHQILILRHSFSLPGKNIKKNIITRSVETFWDCF
jgi:hypothetical protein